MGINVVANSNRNTSVGLGLASLASNALTNVINRYYSEKWNAQSQANFQRELDFNRSEADKNRAYNSVPSLVNQYKAAGLNPNLLAGSIGGVSAQASSPASPEFNGFYASSPVGGAIQSGLGAYQTLNDVMLQQRMNEANVHLAEAKALEAEANAREAGFRDGDYYGAITEERLSRANLNLGQLNKLSSEINLTNEQILNCREQRSYFKALATEHDNLAFLYQIDSWTRDEFNRAKVNESWSQTDLNRAYSDLSRANAALARARKQLTDGEYHILEQTTEAIIKGTKFNVENQTFKYTDVLTGKEVTIVCTPQEAQFAGQLWSNLNKAYGLQIDAMQIDWLDAQTDQTRVETVVNSVTDVIDTGCKLWGTIATGGVGGVIPSGKGSKGAPPSSSYKRLNNTSPLPYERVPGYNPYGNNY